MAIKKLQSNYTTPEQSKRLLELGLPADSADCAYRGLYMPITILSPNELYSMHEKEVHDLETKRDRREGRFQTCEPCWSVGRLMEIVDMCSVKQDYVGKFEFEMNKSYIQNLIYLIIGMLHTKDLDFSKLEE